MTIKQKIIGNSLGSALLVAAVGLLSALNMLRVGSNLLTLAQTELPDLYWANQLASEAARIRLTLTEYLAANHEQRHSAVPRLRAEVDAAFEQFARTIGQLRERTRLQGAAAATGSEEEKDAGKDLDRWDAIEQVSRNARQYWTKLSSLVESRGDLGADPVLIEQMARSVHDLRDHVLELQHVATGDVTQLVQAVHGQATASVGILLCTTVVALCASLILGWLVSMPLAARLSRLRESAIKVGKGDLGARTEVVPNDEIGQLAAAFNSMTASLGRSRDEIRESEARFRELAETIHEVFWVCDVNCTKIQYISPAYEEVWGRSRESIYEDSRSFLEAIVPEDRPRVHAALDKLAIVGLDEEYRIVRPDGTMRRIRARGFVVRDEGGQGKRVVGIAEDITARWRADEEGHRLAEQIRLLLDSTGDGIYGIDAAGRCTFVNKAAAKLLGYATEEILGKHMHDLVHHRHADGSVHDVEQCPIYRAFRTGTGCRVDQDVFWRRDGIALSVEYSAFPILEGEQVTGAVITFSDIAGRNRVEAAESASRAKSEFLAKMSHEIRTPLNGVIGMTDLLLDTSLDPRQLRFAHLIKSSGESLAELVDDILDFSKIEARKLELDCVDFDLYLVAEDVTEMLAHKAAQKGLELTCHARPDVPRWVRGDPERVKQMLVNLVNNAIKFTERGCVSLRVSVEDIAGCQSLVAGTKSGEPSSADLPASNPQSATSSSLMIRFSVTDTGIGIPAEGLGRLFKSFSQVDASTTRSYGGTGLGLAIAKQLAELMGGGVGVDSVVGQGSTFWFTVRLGLQPQARHHIPAPSVDPRGLRVLVVDDSPTVREVLRTQVGSWGMETATASGGEEALRVLKEAAAQGRPYHVALVDDQMPAMSGLELGRATKSRPDAAGTVLLLMLPLDGEVEPAELRAAGFRGHLVKPVRQSLLYDAIMDAVAAAPEAPGAVDFKLAPLTPGRPGDRTTSDAPRARILVAEDNRVNQIVASEILGKHGYAYDIVDDGRKAVAAVSGGNYDLVLMDCLMPEMDGLEAAREIRRREKETNQGQGGTPGAHRHVPIVALTANAIKEDRDRCLAAGMDAYVSKPVRPDRLIEAIESLLARRTAPEPERSCLPEPAPVAPAGEGPPLALDALIEACMGNTATAAVILEEFEKQAVADLAEIERSLQGGDRERAARVAHGLKGASGFLSAAALYRVASELERLGRGSDLAEVDKLLARLRNEVRRCVAYLPEAKAAVSEMAETSA